MSKHYRKNAVDFEKMIKGGFYKTELHAKAAIHRSKLGTAEKEILCKLIDAYFMDTFIRVSGDPKHGEVNKCREKCACKLTTPVQSDKKENGEAELIRLVLDTGLIRSQEIIDEIKTMTNKLQNMRKDK
jgi:hypothetical protein